MGRRKKQQIDNEIVVINDTVPIHKFDLNAPISLSMVMGMDTHYSALEAKVMSLAQAQWEENDRNIDLKYRTNMADLSAVTGISNTDLYEKFNKGYDEVILSKTYRVAKGTKDKKGREEWKRLNFFSDFDYSDGYLTFKINPDILPYMAFVQNIVTTYLFDDVAALRSELALRMFHLCLFCDNLAQINRKSDPDEFAFLKEIEPDAKVPKEEERFCYHRNSCVFTIGYLRKFFWAEGIYLNTNGKPDDPKFIRDIINKYITEVNAKTKLDVSFKVIRAHPTNSIKITHIAFYVDRDNDGILGLREKFNNSALYIPEGNALDTVNETGMCMDTNGQLIFDPELLKIDTRQPQAKKGEHGTANRAARQTERNRLKDKFRKKIGYDGFAPEDMRILDLLVKLYVKVSLTEDEVVTIGKQQFVVEELLDGLEDMTAESVESSILFHVRGKADDVNQTWIAKCVMNPTVRASKKGQMNFKNLGTGKEDDSVDPMIKKALIMRRARQGALPKQWYLDNQRTCESQIPDWEDLYEEYHRSHPEAEK